MIFEKLKTILGRVKPNVDLSTVTMDSRLIADLGIDSLSMMLLAISVEDEFKIEFGDDTNFVTVKEICDFVAEKAGLEV
ncbi:MAG: acyl carrier protein [Lachnospiraceae bacterium]|nr:acyl carrier protein [Lachnospiraceae bacterium]